MKKTAKTIALALCLSMLLPLLFSCGGEKAAQDTKNTAENAAAVETTTGDGLFHDKVPEGLNFGGYEYRILQGTYDRGGVIMFPEEQIGDVLNDAMFDRDRKIEDRFNIKIKAETVSLFSLFQMMTKDVKSGADAYDEYMQIDRDAYTAVGQNLLYPFSQLPYIDLTQAYWCQLPNRQLTVDGKLYWGFSDNMLSFFEAAVVVYFNKKQIENLGLENVYNLVKAGNWTHDRFYEYAKAAAKDTDGDGKMTEADNWGIISETDYFYPCFWISAGFNLVEKDQNDMPYFNVPGNQLFFDIADKVNDNLHPKGGVLLNSQTNIPKGFGSNSADARVAFFRAGQSLFSVGETSEMIRLRDMPDDFGIIPFPKYTADQSQYYTRVCVGFPFVVPTTITNPEIAGAIMESMACEARNTIIPAYYESALKNKYSRDSDTAEMLDLIFNTRVYDLGDTIWCMTIRIGYTGVFVKGDGSFASFTEKNAEKFIKEINKSVEAILNNN